MSTVKCGRKYWPDRSRINPDVPPLNYRLPGIALRIGDHIVHRSAVQKTFQLTPLGPDALIGVGLNLKSIQ